MCVSKEEDFILIGNNNFARDNKKAGTITKLKIDAKNFDNMEITNTYKKH